MAKTTTKSLLSTLEEAKRDLQATEDTHKVPKEKLKMVEGSSIVTYYASKHFTKDVVTLA